MSDLIRGRFSRTPRWDLVHGFVSACIQYGKERRVALPPELASMEYWRRHYTELSLFFEGGNWKTSPLIRVIIAENIQLLRTAIVSLLSTEEDIEVVADLPVNSRVVTAAINLQPDVIVVSADQPENDGLSTILELRKRLPESHLVALTQKRPAGLLKRLLGADVAGLIDKDAPAARLLHGIRGVAQGGTVIDANLVIAALSAGRNPFTPRELSVLRLAADGASGPEIAEQLSLTPGTVRNYLSNAMNKTGARTRIDALRVASESGWL